MQQDDIYLKQVYSELEALMGVLETISREELVKLVKMAGLIAEAIDSGHVIFTCGNGGSAADAQHIVGELVGRFRKKPKGYRAFALTTNSSIVTSLANDFSFDEVFSKQLESGAGAGDVLLALSTSGSSPNVIRAVERAAEMGMASLAFSGKGGGDLAMKADIAFVVPHDDFARIQEVHMTLGHILCGLVEEFLEVES
ncbi:MAG: SIS domain-containing protein [Candidatus Krumholzibacteria bacterium]|nr:SIS domain-containing protein [Candidatus Krumholzibacteria bacterium]